MDQATEQWTTSLYRAVGLALAGFLFMSSLALAGSLASHGRHLPDVATTEIAPDAIRRTAQLLDPPTDRWTGVRAVSSPGRFEGDRGSGR